MYLALGIGCACSLGGGVKPTLLDLGCICTQRFSLAACSNIEICRLWYKMVDHSQPWKRSHHWSQIRQGRVELAGGARPGFHENKGTYVPFLFLIGSRVCTSFSSKRGVLMYLEVFFGSKGRYLGVLHMWQYQGSPLLNRGGGIATRGACYCRILIIPLIAYLS
jgi:hypothetical protein